MKPFKRMTSSNTILMVVDIINSCADQKCELPQYKVTFSKIRKMIPKLNQFIDKYRSVSNNPIFFIKTVPWQKEYLADNVNQLYERKYFSYYSTDTTGYAEKFYQLNPKESDVVIEKNTVDAFSIKRLNIELKKRGIKYIIITGIFTDGCVLATVAGGFSRGYNIIVLKDLVQTTDVPKRQEIQKHLLTYTFPFLFARVCSSSQILKDWSEIDKS